MAGNQTLCLSARLKWTVNHKDRLVKSTKAKLEKRAKDKAKRALRAQVSEDAALDNEYVRSRVGANGTCSYC